MKHDSAGIDLLRERLSYVVVEPVLGGLVGVGEVEAVVAGLLLPRIDEVETLRRAGAKKLCGEFALEDSNLSTNAAGCDEGQKFGDGAGGEVHD